MTGLEQKRELAELLEAVRGQLRALEDTAQDDVHRAGTGRDIDRQAGGVDRLLRKATRRLEPALAEPRVAVVGGPGSGRKEFLESLFPVLGPRHRVCTEQGLRQLRPWTTAGILHGPGDQGSGCVVTLSLRQFAASRGLIQIEPLSDQELATLASAAGSIGLECTVDRSIAAAELVLDAEEESVASLAASLLCRAGPLTPAEEELLARRLGLLNGQDYRAYTRTVKEVQIKISQQVCVDLLRHDGTAGVVDTLQSATFCDYPSVVGRPPDHRAGWTVEELKNRLLFSRALPALDLILLFVPGVEAHGSKMPLVELLRCANEPGTVFAGEDYPADGGVQLFDLLAKTFVVFSGCGEPGARPMTEQVESLLHGFSGQIMHHNIRTMLAGLALFSTPDDRAAFASDPDHRLDQVRTATRGWAHADELEQDTRALCLTTGDDWHIVRRLVSRLAPALTTAARRNAVTKILGDGKLESVLGELLRISAAAPGTAATQRLELENILSLANQHMQSQQAHLAKATIEERLEVLTNGPGEWARQLAELERTRRQVPRGSQHEMAGLHQKLRRILELVEILKAAV